MPNQPINIPRDSTIQEMIEVMKEQNSILLLANPQNPETAAPVLVPTLIDKFGAKKAFTTYLSMRLQNGDPPSLYTAVCEFYNNAKTGKIYGSEFYCFKVSNVSTGTLKDESAKLGLCVPGTNTTPAVDPYADLALFMPIDVNYKIGDDFEPEITEIKGVTDGFSLTKPNGLVGVMQMTPWVYLYNNGTTKGVKYSDTQISANYKPLPEGVKKIDNKPRPFMIHAKYVAGKDEDGLLASASGLHPAVSSPSGRLHTSISHDGQITLWRQRGANYSGGSLCDRNFMLLMFMIKYAHLDSSSVMAGCNSYSTTYKVALGETDTNRALLTPANADYFLIGSTISIGTGTDRNTAAGHDILDHYRITRKESVTLNGTVYTAVYTDAPETFTTTTDHNVIPEPWASGSTDDVLGNDGSPNSNTSSKDACKIQGIEFMTGTYEVLADTAIYLNADKTASVHMNRQASKLATGSAGADSYLLAEKIPRPEVGAWLYIAECGNSLEGLIVPTETGGSSATAFRAGLYMEVDTAVGWREWRASGYLSDGGYAGLPCVNGSSGLAYAHWNIACRASGTGGNRGEWVA